MKAIYVTVVSSLYAAYALVVARALARHGRKLVVYGVDDGVPSLLDGLLPDGCCVVPLTDYEGSELAEIHARRTVTEFCWTTKSIALEHVLGLYPEAEWAVYLDSDMMIYADPDQALPTDGDILLTLHRPSTPHFESFIASVGRYNAGYIAFRNTVQGSTALSWWRGQCEDSCSAQPSSTGYGDQRYLNELSAFPGAVENTHNGLNAAPWNIFGKTVWEDGDLIRIDGEPLLVYHMQGFRAFGGRVFDLYAGQCRIPRAVRDTIYRRYVVHLIDSAATAPNYIQHALFAQRWTLRLLLIELKRTLQGISNFYVAPR